MLNQSRDFDHQNYFNTPNRSQCFLISKSFLKFFAIFLVGLLIGKSLANYKSYVVFVNNGAEHPRRNGSLDYPDNTIIVITPTVQKAERLGDLTMLSQTLMHVKNIHWLVIEDANETYPLIDRFLQKTGIKYTYLYTTNRGLPCRGWAQRNLAFDYLRQNRNLFGKNDVIYFADDDNAYNYRIFDEYIRKVTTMGVWAVGTSGSTYVESPVVENGKVVGFHVMFRPERKYATDMSGFALNIDVLLNSNATFNLHCAGTVPEECFLRQVNVPFDKLEPFGHGTQEDKEVYVWHRRTAKAHILPWPTNGYAIEEDKLQPRSCDRLRNINHVTYEEIKLLSELGDD